MRVTVVQPGARRHYAVAASYSRAGVLNRLYTDMHADHWWLRAADAVLPGARPKPIRRLLGRRLPVDLTPGAVDDSPIHTIASRLRLPFPMGGSSSARILSRIESAHLGDGDIVHTLLINEDVETMRGLKERGARIVHDCMIGPDVARWVDEERQRFPGIEERADPAEVAAGLERDKLKYALADLILAPSEFTANGIRELAGPDAKIRVVPFGYDPAKTIGAPQPETGRVLFVGATGLRKGCPYLATAARDLRKRDAGIHVRVVGPADPRALAREEFQGPTYVGQVPRSQVQEEYRKADVFVLPTICDSFAIVHLEAMALGIPIITTPNCGSLVRDGVEGFIVPIRDPRAIADRIQRIVGDRDLRAAMSANARKRAAEFSVDSYSRRLVATVREELA